MKVLLYSYSAATAKEIKFKLAKHEVIIAQTKSKFLEFAYDDKFDAIFADILEDSKEEIKELMGAKSEAKIFILSHEPNFSDGRQYLHLGAKGYGNAHMLEVHFNDALEAIGRGEIWLYPEFIQNMIYMMTKEIPVLNSSNLLDKLTSKEKEIADLVYKGLTNQEIADVAQITVRTVKAHISTIFEKTGAKDRINLILLMQKNV